MLTYEIAKQIVRETMNRLNRNINIMDHTGTIMASGDPSRVGEVHEGAADVIRTGHPLMITEDNQQKYKGVRPGINLPIVFQDKIIGVIGITGDPEEILEFGELVKMITEMMINQSFLASQLEWKQRMKEMIFEELIRREPNIESAVQRLTLLKMKLRAPYQVALIELRELPKQGQELIQKVEDLLNDKQLLVGFRSVNRMFILATGLEEQLVRGKLGEVENYLRQKGIAFKIGMGSQVTETGKIGMSLEEAKLALLLGEGEQGLISYLDVETKALINRMDPQVKQKFVDRIFANTPQTSIETLEAFFDSNLNIGEAAKLLFIHRNTLIYRLAKIKERTGYDPQIFHDAVSLQLAVWMYQNQGRSEGEGPGE
ncbi:helix-turn-helix domain-containing protein [Brevibacillus ruminantium]|uniref:Helix-turn-helix domain-containing protein n=1 Tax=Brevibacillus ruminantium TaxID=2950604 RepID=A0ABY4WCN8_9BACL|nr:sugar diacid recognition domain-containing protein [Brevibacillus ruminantium]USG64955.1 helix-turn-helix domain-containing protein [Brevibacillus ruminantium]